MRTLVLTILIFNVTFGAAWSVLVLYATEHLGLGSVGFGLITTVGAAGGLLGTLSYGWLTRRISLGNLMRIGLIIETLTHLGAGLDLEPVRRAAGLLRLRRARVHLGHHLDHHPAARGARPSCRAGSGAVNLVGVFGGLVVGAAIGGLLAQHWGVTAPFWFAFVGSAVFVVLIWRQLSHIAHADEQSRWTSATISGGSKR